MKFARKRDGLGGIHTELHTFERGLRGILLGLRFFQRDCAIRGGDCAQISIDCANTVIIA